MNTKQELTTKQTTISHNKSGSNNNRLPIPKKTYNQTKAPSPQTPNQFFRHFVILDLFFWILHSKKLQLYTKMKLFFGGTETQTQLFVPRLTLLQGDRL